MGLKQRSRLDIFTVKTQRQNSTVRSTVTDPTGSGIGHSAFETSSGCDCRAFKFSEPIKTFSYLGHSPSIANCSRQPDTIIEGKAARHWSIILSHPVYEQLEYYAAMTEPWPLRIVTEVGTQDFPSFTGRAAPLATFAPQLCCRASEPGRASPPLPVATPHKPPSPAPLVHLVAMPPPSPTSGLRVEAFNITTQRTPGVPVPAWLATIPFPQGHVHALPPTPSGCDGREKPSVIGRSCAWMVNGGPFTFLGGKCLGGLVSDGKIVAPLGASDAVRWAVTANGSHVLGPLSDADVTRLRVTQLLSGFLHGGFLVESHKPTTYPRNALIAPRTAVGVDDHGGLLILTVDGSEGHVGLNLTETAAAMAAAGALHAVNLDGGGSTSASSFGEVVDQPTCDDQMGHICERKVASTLCVKN